MLVLELQGGLPVLPVKERLLREVEEVKQHVDSAMYM